MSSNCKDCCSYFALSISTLFFCLMITVYTVRSGGNVNVVLVDLNSSVIFTTDERFLSIGLDSSVIANGFKGFNMSDPKLIRIIKNLSPGYIRVGGNLADRLLFTEKNDFQFKTSWTPFLDGDTCSYDPIYCEYQVKPNFTMSSLDWISLNMLAKNTNFQMIFDLNVLLRTKNDAWESKNAKALINFSAIHDFNINWELGNEPNAFRHQFNYPVNATQLAKDYKVLREILRKNAKYERSLLIGPSVTRPDPLHSESVKYLKEFLLHASNEIDVVTWHHYYFNGRIVQAHDFLDLKYFNIFHWQLNVINEIHSKMKLKNKIWIGETASAWGGGSPKYSDKFISLFLWIDKLGLAAKHNISVVIKQSIFNGNYALISSDYTPNPNYWLSVLYKKLVGPQVLTCYNIAANKIRLYCHCTNKDLTDKNFGSITVFGLNIQNTPSKVRIEGLFNLKNVGQQTKVLQYSLTSLWTLMTKNVYLNGKLLSLTESGNLPLFQPKIVNSEPYLIMPPYSVVFWVVPTKSNICI